MDIMELRRPCPEELPFTGETAPFGITAFVYKVVCGRMFVSCGAGDSGRTDLEGDPGRAVELRERYPARIRAGRRVHGVHWNTVSAGGSLPDRMLRGMIVESCRLAAAELFRAERGCAADAPVGMNLTQSC